MRHSKRTKLINEDVMNALKLRNIKVIFLLIIQSIYGHLGQEASSYKVATESITGTKELYYIPQDKELKLDDLLNEPLPDIPYEISYRAHWLAINGVQPNIPENPSTDITPLPMENEIINGSTHSLSKELENYYEKVINVLKGDTEDMINYIMKNLEEEGGYNQLIPYFIQFFANEVRNYLSLKDKPPEMFSRLCNYIRAMRCFIVNPNNNLNSYLHQIIPTILSCALGKKLSSNPEDDHWKLRKESINLLKLICEQFKVAYPDLEARSVGTLKGVINSKTCKTGPLYGALLGLRAFGPLVIQKVLIPQIKNIHEFLKEQMKDEDKNISKDGNICFDIFFVLFYL